MATVLEWKSKEGNGEQDLAEEVARLRAENRRLQVTLGAFSAFTASRGLLDEAWHYVHNVYEHEDGRD